MGHKLYARHLRICGPFCRSVLLIILSLTLSSEGGLILIKIFVCQKFYMHDLI